MSRENTFQVGMFDHLQKSVEQKLNEIGINVAPFESKDKMYRRKLYKDGVEIDNCTAYEAMIKYLNYKSLYDTE